jgi:phosphoribosylglycinamide formyltransferase-1
MSLAKLRVGVLVSGRGSNLTALLQAAYDNAINAEVVVVVSNKSTARALERAESFGVPTAVVDHRVYGNDRVAFERAVHRELLEKKVELVVLAGFMRVLSPYFVGKWPTRIVNIHPSLLPSFPGLHAHRKALAAGVKVAGCTVHYVDEGTDTGPIIAQAAVPVLIGDTEETLGARVLAEEHRLLSEVIHWIATGRVHVKGRLVSLEPENG